MNRPPRDPNEQMLTRKGLLKSVLQGFVMFASAFGIYYWTILQQPSNAPLARTMGLSVLMLSNLLLVLVNSSDHDSILHSVRRMAKDRVMWAVNIGVLVGLALILYTPMSSVLKLAPLTAIQLLTIVGLAIVSTCWFEIVKKQSADPGIGSVSSSTAQHPERFRVLRFFLFLCRSSGKQNTLCLFCIHE